MRILIAYGNNEGELHGRWRVENTAHIRQQFEFFPNGTVISGDGRLANAWRIDGDQLAIAGNVIGKLDIAGTWTFTISDDVLTLHEDDGHTRVFTRIQ